MYEDINSLVTMNIVREKPLGLLTVLPREGAGQLGYYQLVVVTLINSLWKLYNLFPITIKNNKDSFLYQ